MFAVNGCLSGKAFPITNEFLLNLLFPTVFHQCLLKQHRMGQEVHSSLDGFYGKANDCFYLFEAKLQAIGALAMMGIEFLGCVVKPS